jgi:nitrite reductase (NADH) small subunit
MNDEMKWLRITHSDNIPLRQGRSLQVAGHEVAIFNLGDRFLAIDNRCPHNQGPLCDGIVSGTTVVCPLHAWKVDLESGAVQRPQDTQACVKTFRTEVVDGIILLEVPVQKPVFSEFPIFQPDPITADASQTQIAL